jgi:hypothetical protein
LARRVNGVYLHNLSRLVWILREKYPRVLEADRRFEEETGFRNKLGTNNLVDALSHIGTLFEAAPDSSYDSQRAQITLFEDHLRRTMMEAWEQMLNFQMGEIDKLWYGQYLKEARPLQNSGELPGSPSAHQLDVKRKRYVRLLQEGRGFKRGYDWKEWEEGTDKFIEACHEASELRELLEEAIKAAKGAADKHRAQEEDNRRHQQTMRRDLGNKVLAAIAIAVSIAGGIGVGTLISDKSANSSTTVIQQKAPLHAQQQKDPEGEDARSKGHS